MEGDYSETRALLHHHLGLATDLVARCQKFSLVKGSSKLVKKCQAELRFLEGLQRRSPHELKECHLKSSNLASLEGIVVAMETLPNVTSILQPFQYITASRHPVVVDLVCNHGYTWVKVIARKAQALHLVWAGGGQFGERNIADQADEFREVAQGHKQNFKVPQILFIFTNGVTTPLREALTNQGIDVQGEEVPVDEDTQHKLELANDSFYSSEEEDRSGSEHMSGVGVEEEVQGEEEKECRTSGQGLTMKEEETDLTQSIMVGTSAHAGGAPGGGTDGMNTGERDVNQCLNQDHRGGTGKTRDLLTPLPEVNRINLDITSLISLVSNQCHGRCYFVFQEEVLTRQAAQERISPSLPKLHQFMAGKEVFACETAVQDFRTILKTVGGAHEKARAELLLQTLHIVPDCPSDGANQLSVSAKVKDRAKNIFGTGDSLQAITMSANVGFVRAAANQGVNFAVYLHEPRALTEQKEASATPLNDPPASS